MRTFIIFMTTVFLSSASLMAQSLQDQYPLIPCENVEIHKNLVIANEAYINNDGRLNMFHVITVPNDAFVPVLINVKKGQRYALNLSVDDDFKKMDVVIIDGDKNEILKHSMRNQKGEGSVVKQMFTAKETGHYWMILSQKVKRNASNCLGVGIVEIN